MPCTWFLANHCPLIDSPKTPCTPGGPYTKGRPIPGKKVPGTKRSWFRIGFQIGSVEHSATYHNSSTAQIKRLRGYRDCACSLWHPNCNTQPCHAISFHEPLTSNFQRSAERPVRLFDANYAGNFFLKCHRAMNETDWHS